MLLSHGLDERCRAMNRDDKGSVARPEDSMGGMSSTRSRVPIDDDVGWERVGLGKAKKPEAFLLELSHHMVGVDAKAVRHPGRI